MGLSNIEDCMLLSIFFNDGTTVAEVEALVHSYPFEGLRGFASVDKDAPDGTRLTFAEDGGTRRVPDDTDAELDLGLDIWRVAEGMGDIAPVIPKSSSAEKWSTTSSKTTAAASTSDTTSGRLGLARAWALEPWQRVEV